MFPIERQVHKYTHSTHQVSTLRGRPARITYLMTVERE
jgi:hypothetical protein